MSLSGAESGKLAITLIGASAGSGKTHRLATEFVSAVLRGKDSGSWSSEKILSTTFTNKAADELVERVRSYLLEKGEINESMLVLTGYIGTVNSVCGQLVQEFCLEAGLSPCLNVLPAEHVQSVLSVSAASAIASIDEAAESAAFRLSLSNWHESITTIVRLARANGLSPDDVRNCAISSWDGLKKLFPASTQEGSEENAGNLLHSAIDRCIQLLETGSDGTKKTQEALLKLKEKQAALASYGYLTWADWAVLSKLSVGKDSMSCLEPVLAAARLHPSQTLLREDIQLYLNTLFACAATAMLQYEEFKRVHALMDFADQEYLLLELLKNENVKQLVSERVKIALVDEFQDTSPIQLAIFLKIAELVESSVWVGDEKQAIYGFRGTDPQLMQGLIAHLSRLPDTRREQLCKSFRSRPQLVKFANDAFAEPFKACGISPENTIMSECHRESSPAIGNALHAWWLAGENWDAALQGLALKVAAILQHPDAWLVEDRESKSLRPLRGADVGILCRKNDRCLALSAALAEKGVRVDCKRTGLLNTPECTLAFAALRYLVDRRDSLAALELMHLSENTSERGHYLRKCFDTDDKSEALSNTLLSSIDGVRHLLPQLTPGEALELAMASGNVIRAAQSWGQAAQRLGNLDAFRGLARLYEETCLSRRAAATPAGFITFLSKELAEGGDQASGNDENAVHVLTYHGAKGLEWPLVILVDLQSPAEPSPFGIFAESKNSAIDIVNPLEGRWMRCWPWPYGAQSKNVYLDATAAESPEMEAARVRSLAENIRLLYVGVTRARDYLVFAARDSKSNCGWIELLNDKHGKNSMHLPVEEGRQALNIGNGSHVIEVTRTFIPEETQFSRVDLAGPCTLFGPPQVCYENAREFLPYKIVPSQARQAVAGELRVDLSTRIITLGRRLPIRGKPDMENLGEVMHRFLAVDMQSANKDESLRTELATRLLQRWHVEEMDAQYIVEASNRLSLFVSNAYPGSTLRLECPVVGRVGLQRALGRIDLLLETSDGFVVIDHKTYPGRFETWSEQAISHAPQLNLYRSLVSQATGRNVLSLLVHMPVVGSIIEYQLAEPLRESVNRQLCT